MHQQEKPWINLAWRLHGIYTQVPSVKHKNVYFISVPVLSCSLFVVCFPWLITVELSGHLPTWDFILTFLLNNMRPAKTIYIRHILKASFYSQINRYTRNTELPWKSAPAPARSERTVENCQDRKWCVLMVCRCD